MELWEGRRIQRLGVEGAPPGPHLLQSQNREGLPAADSTGHKALPLSLSLSPPTPPPSHSLSPCPSSHRKVSLFSTTLFPRSRKFFFSPPSLYFSFPRFPGIAERRGFGTVWRVAYHVIWYVFGPPEQRNWGGGMIASLRSCRYFAGDKTEHGTQLPSCLR